MTTSIDHNFLGFELPDELIARYPLEQRDASKMLLARTVDVCPFKTIIDELNAGDLLILNDTKVQPARLTSFKKETSGKVTLLVLELRSPEIAVCLVKCSHRLHIGQMLDCGGIDLEVIELQARNKAVLRCSGTWADLMEHHGHMPLPPYLKRESEELDRERYQSVWAKETGSSAAPTASLHFTPEVIEALIKKGVQISYCTLHVGLGTFLPVQKASLDEHVMHEEWFCVPAHTLEKIRETRAQGRQVVAVGTTVVRALESVCDPESKETVQGPTTLFIRPGFDFRFVDRLLTNFHQVDSTLILLVQAFAGHQKIHDCYKKAVAEQMRLYSYGDCILLDKETS